MTLPAGLNAFISYARGGHGHTWAQRVDAALAAAGAVCFFDEHNIAEGDPSWLARLAQGLQAADLLVCVVDHGSAACTWQQRELIRADRLQLPVVALRVDKVDLPFAIAECQPIELRANDPDGSLARLVQAVARAAPQAQQTAEAADLGHEAARQLQAQYLRTLLAGDLAQREDLYIPLAAQEQRGLGLERAVKGLRIDTTLLLQRFQLGGAVPGVAPAPVAYADVLDAYRALPQRRARHLVVLGEPGAGKSFSLERLAVHHARDALRSPRAVLPVLVKLGLWTRADEPLQAFIQRQVDLVTPGLGRHFGGWRDAGRVVLLLDGLNEIPPGQRDDKTAQLRCMAEDERFAAVVLSCRERDFTEGAALPFDRLTLQPLTPPQVHGFLHRLYRLADGDVAGAERAEQRFWQLAGGPPLQAVWQAWQGAGASWAQFWTADDIPRKQPNVYGATTGEQDQLWRQMRADRRSLLALAANPYLLAVMAMLPTLPHTRAALFSGFLAQLHDRERLAREQRHDAAAVPAFQAWHATLVQLAEALQRARPAAADQNAGDDDEAVDGGAGTSLPRAAWPAAMTEAMRAFSIDASVLQQVGDDLRFSHQLLQESLAAQVLVQAAQRGTPSAASLWPADAWWQPQGWEVVAELAAESVAQPGTAAASPLAQLLHWLAQAQPEVAARAWRAAGQPMLPEALREHIRQAWLPRLTDAQAEPMPRARAAIGRALALLGLDDRPGVGLGADGLPDVDWVRIETPQPFIYQGQPQPPLPPFDLARYPVTNAQFQAFIDDGGYAPQAPWWQGLQRPAGPAAARWPDANAPRETVSWYEACAFARWLAARTGQAIGLPTEKQWERAAAGTDGRTYPWGNDWRPELANGRDPDTPGGMVGRTCAVGMYPGRSDEGVADLAGNVLEWTASPNQPRDSHASTARVLRGGSWSSDSGLLRAAVRFHGLPDGSFNNIGIRLCRSSPIDLPVAGALNAEPLAR